jgi:transposase IS116/IS110/IS902 family protein
MGRSLLLQRAMAVRGRWWRGRTWEQILAAMPNWVIAQLEIWKAFLELAAKQVGRIEMQLKKAAPRQLFFGEGELTHELLARELIDPQRFRNARQLSNYFGLCPSESTSDQRRRMGSITKHGNPRLRRLMVELAWRVSHLPALLPRGAPMGSPAPQSQSLHGRSQESHRGAGPASRRRPLANGHRARPGRRTRAALKRDPADEPEKESLPIRKSLTLDFRKALDRRTLATVAEHQKSSLCRLRVLVPLLDPNTS